jgi:hypothetical protein
VAESDLGHMIRCLLTPKGAKPEENSGLGACVNPNSETGFAVSRPLVRPYGSATCVFLVEVPSQTDTASGARWKAPLLYLHLSARDRKEWEWTHSMAVAERGVN